MGNEPRASTYAEVAAVLRDMADRVEAGDSMEGSIEYGLPAMPDEYTLDDVPEVMLRASYRVGNTLGQGGVRLIGSLGLGEPPAPRPHDPCGCCDECGDDGDPEGPGVCKGLPRPPQDPLVVVEVVHRDDLPPRERAQ